MTFTTEQQARLRTVLAALVNQAPLAPHLELLANDIQSLTPAALRRSERKRGVLAMVTAAVVVFVGIGVAGLIGSNSPSFPADETATMQPGVGADPSVEAILEESVEGYVGGTGQHVATYVGPGGPIDVYFYRQDIVRLPPPPETGTEDPLRTIRAYCVGWGITEQGVNASCGTQPFDSIETPRLVAVDVKEADGSGFGLVLTPPDVVEAILGFLDQTQVSVRTAEGVAYATWDNGGFPRHYEIVRTDGTRQAFRPFT